MSIDLTQFFQVFFEEAAEHLATMETLLLALDVADPDMDDLNAIFRSAHSIKGGAGTFGFNDMTEVTHVLETLLDKLRKQEMTLTDEMVSAFLEAGDVISTQLAAHRGEGEVDQAEVKEVCEKLERLISDQPSGNGENSSAPPLSPPLATAKDENKDYGFFDETYETNKTEETAYGFFGDDPGATSSLSTTPLAEQDLPVTPDANNQDASSAVSESKAVALEDEQAYGFFEDLPQTPPANEPNANEQKPTAPSNDQAYGFFHDLPSSSPDIPASAADELEKSAQAVSTDTSTQKTAEQETDKGYGFFHELQPRPQVTPAAPEQKKPAKVVTEAAKQGTKRAADKPAASAAETSIRVSVEKVDQLINLAGELVITQAMLVQSAIGSENENLQSGLYQLDRNTRDLQEAVMSIRMMPISFVFSRFPRLVRDLAGKLNKQVELKTVGENTELDKGLIEKIADPLTHLVRNSLDHGVESPEKRIAAGKNPRGTITLKASHQGGNVVIEVSDDGGGLSRSKILSKAKERDLPVSDDMSDQDVWGLIMAPGFSTAEAVTDVSGRGVGMDVVKRNIAEIGGRVELDSVEGFGSRVIIRLPLTLAILDGLSVSVGEETYIIPLNSIIESLQVSEVDLKTVSGEGQLLRVRGEYLPLVKLHEVFHTQPKANNLQQGITVIVEAEGKKTALFVDELLGQHQVVIKSLESNYRKIRGISGATIMGDGRVALILDVAALITQHSSNVRTADTL